MRIRALLAAFIIAPAFAVVGSADAQTVQGPKVTWKVGAWGKPRAASKGVDFLAAYVKEQTGGKFTINVGYGSYGEPKELLDLLSVGALEATNMCSSYHPEKHPAYTALDLPFLPFPNADVQEKVHEKFHQHPYIKQEMAKWKALLLHVDPAAAVRVHRPRQPAPKKLSDWKGLQGARDRRHRRGDGQGRRGADVGRRDRSL